MDKVYNFDLAEIGALPAGEAAKFSKEAYFDMQADQFTRVMLVRIFKEVKRRAKMGFNSVVFDLGNIGTSFNNVEEGFATYNEIRKILESMGYAALIRAVQGNSIHAIEIKWE